MFVVLPSMMPFKFVRPREPITMTSAPHVLDSSTISTATRPESANANLAGRGDAGVCHLLAGLGDTLDRRLLSLIGDCTDGRREWAGPVRREPLDLVHVKDPDLAPGQAAEIFRRLDCVL